MRLFGLIFAFSLISIPTTSFSCDEYGHTGIADDNDWWIPVNEGKGEETGITEEEFHDVLDLVEDYYRPILSSMGKNLVVERKWDDGTVNAYAFQRGNNWHIAMFGGLARHYHATADAFALVACHELGHHIGGAPKKGTSWATNEGQADYYGSSKCFKRIYETDDNNWRIGFADVHPMMERQCKAIYGSDFNQVALCKRASVAGQGLANLLSSLRDPNGKLPSVDNPDKTVVSKTDHNHPNAQCRLDTYFEGSLCELNYQHKEFCTRNGGYETLSGVRPLCWYKPKGGSGPKPPTPPNPPSDGNGW